QSVRAGRRGAPRRNLQPRRLEPEAVLRARPAALVAGSRSAVRGAVQRSGRGGFHARPRGLRNQGARHDDGLRDDLAAAVTATAQAAPSSRAAGATLVLLTLATGQFLMTLDSSVMNVSIATVAKDVGTTVTGIQGAITAYTLVMAALMI